MQLPKQLRGAAKTVLALLAGATGAEVKYVQCLFCKTSQVSEMDIGYFKIQGQRCLNCDEELPSAFISKVTERMTAELMTNMVKDYKKQKVRYVNRDGAVIEGSMVDGSIVDAIFIDITKPVSYPCPVCGKQIPFDKDECQECGVDLGVYDGEVIEAEAIKKDDGEENKGEKAEKQDEKKGEITIEVDKKAKEE
jgi:hypothetical protein